jgi:hypothetical protein
LLQNLPINRKEAHFPLCPALRESLILIKNTPQKGKTTGKQNFPMVLLVAARLYKVLCRSS